MKNFNKKIRKLEARIQKDMKKLSKLKRKMGAAAEKKKDRATPPVSKKAAPAKPSRAPKKKKKRNISPEARAKLAALMKARWDAKRASAPPAGDDSAPAEGGS